MDSQRPSSIPEGQGGEPAYQGKLGQTRTEHVHVIMADGSMRSVEVPRVVNAATDPDLKTLVLERRLHRLQDGRDLKLSFVYHDPDARKFALIVPTALAHLELKERAKLMNELSEDSENPVPVYVRRCTTVIGIDALEAYLREPVAMDDAGLSMLPPQERERELENRKRVLAEKERSIASRERSLIAVEESIRDREEELRERVRRVEAKQAQLDIRLARLEERQKIRREDEYEPVNGLAQPVSEDGEWREVSSFSPHRMSALPEPGVEQVPALDEHGERLAEIEQDREVDDAEVEEVRISSRRLSSPPPLSLPRRTVAGGPPPLRPHGRVLPPALNLRSTRTDEEPWQDTHTVVAPVPSGSDVEDSPSSTLNVDPYGTKVMVAPETMALPRPDVDPPVRFLATDDVQMSVVLEEQPWLFVRVYADHEHVLSKSSDLLVQYMQIEDYPVVFLALVDAFEGEPFVRRAVLDPLRLRDRQVLEALQSSYEARVAIYVGDEFKRSFEIAAFREAVVGAILQQVEEVPPPQAISASEALTRAAEEPPPINRPDLPFGPPQKQAATLEVVRGAVERLAEWMQPEKLQEAILTYAVPPHVIDASAKRVLEAALKMGVALPEQLLERAVQMGVGPDRAAIVEQQLEAFAARLDRPGVDRNDQFLQENCQELLQLAEVFELEVNDAIRRFTEPPEPDPAPVPVERRPSQAPASESRPHAPESAQPARESAQPARESSPPARESRPPAPESAQPARESAQPARESSPPARESAQPARESAQPAGESSPPARESRPHAAEDDSFEDAEEVRDEELIPQDEQPEPGAEFLDEATMVMDEELEEIDRPSLGSLSRAELVRLLEQPDPDFAAAVELCRRRETATVSTIVRAMERMSDRNLFCVAPYLLLMGESSGDVLIPALGSKSPAVRHASALLLGRLRLRRAIAPLLQQLRAEETALWTEIARALGEFGASASRRVISALRAGKGADQRFVLALAHLSNHGCDREIEKLQKDSNSRVAAAARTAVAQRSKVQWEDLAIREQGKIADESPIARLSQLFYSKAVIVQSEL